MTLQEKLDKFKAGTAVLHTPTGEIYDKLMVGLEKLGYKWGGVTRATDYEAGWGAYREHTCIWGQDLILKYASCSFYTMKGYEILELTLEDFETPKVIPVETVESVMDAIDELNDDLDLYQRLQAKYDSGDVVASINGKIQALLEKRVIS